ESVCATVEDALSRFSAQITKVEVYFGDENAGKYGEVDKCCMMEVRLEGYRSIVVTYYAESVVQAFDGVAECMVHRLDHTFGRLQDQRRHGNFFFLESD